MPSETLDAMVRNVAEEIRLIIGEGRFFGILKCLYSRDNQALSKEIECLLAPLFDDQEKEKHQVLAKARYVFEACLAQQIARDPERREAARGAMEAILRQMVALIHFDNVTKATLSEREEFWALDVRFHTVLGEILETPYMSQVVTMIEEKIRAIALARNQDEMAKACSEHEDIFLAIVSDPGSDQKIEAAICKHVLQSIERWFRRNDMDVEPMLNEIWMTHGYLSPDKEAEFREDLKCQLEHAGQHVAYIDRWDETGGKRQLKRELLFASEDAGDFFTNRTKRISDLEPEERSKVRTRFFIRPTATTL